MTALKCSINGIPSCVCFQDPSQPPENRGVTDLRASASVATCLVGRLAPAAWKRFQTSEYRPLISSFILSYNNFQLSSVLTCNIVLLRCQHGMDMTSIESNLLFLSETSWNWCPSNVVAVFQTSVAQSRVQRPLPSKFHQLC